MKAPDVSCGTRLVGICRLPDLPRGQATTPARAVVALRWEGVDRWLIPSVVAARQRRNSAAL